jgi:hypothetical protein
MLFVSEAELLLEQPLERFPNVADQIVTAADGVQRIPVEPVVAALADPVAQVVLVWILEGRCEVAASDGKVEFESLIGALEGAKWRI